MCGAGVSCLVGGSGTGFCPFPHRFISGSGRLPSFVVLSSPDPTGSTHRDLLHPVGSEFHIPLCKATCSVMPGVPKRRIIDTLVSMAFVPWGLGTPDCPSLAPGTRYLAPIFPSLPHSILGSLTSGNSSVPRCQGANTRNSTGLSKPR